MPRTSAYRTWNDTGTPVEGHLTRAYPKDVDDPLAMAIVGIAFDEAIRVDCDIAWALACLQNSVNVTRRPA